MLILIDDNDLYDILKNMMCFCGISYHIMNQKIIPISSPDISYHPNIYLSPPLILGYP